eukprot:gene4782-567_t
MSGLYKDLGAPDLKHWFESLQSKPAYVAKGWDELPVMSVRTWRRMLEDINQISRVTIKTFAQLPQDPKDRVAWVNRITRICQTQRVLKAECDDMLVQDEFILGANPAHRMASRRGYGDADDAPGLRE